MGNSDVTIPLKCLKLGYFQKPREHLARKNSVIEQRAKRTCITLNCWFGSMNQFVCQFSFYNYQQHGITLPQVQRNLNKKGSRLITSILFIISCLVFVDYLFISTNLIKRAAEKFFG